MLKIKDIKGYVENFFFPTDKEPTLKSEQSLRRFKRSDDEDKSFDYHDPEMDATERLLKNLRKQTIQEGEKLKKIEQLVAEGANVNFVDTNRISDTPLHIAVREKHVEIVKFLIEKGAKLNIKNSRGKTPLDIAERIGLKEIITILKDANNQASEGLKNSPTNNEAKRASTGNSPPTKKNKPSSIERGASGAPQQKRRSNVDARGVIRPSRSRISVIANYEQNPNYAASGLKNTLHGNIYQLKLLMLFLKRGLNKNYSFLLATEMDAAEKFDDLVFQYENEMKDKIIFRFLQAKHKQDESKRITMHELLTEKDGDFSLQKYFLSYLKIKEKNEFKGNTEFKDFVICTNIGVDENLQDSFERVTEEDDILGVPYAGKASKRLKFKKDFTDKSKLISVLVKNTDFHRLATRLSHCIEKNYKIDLKDKLFVQYQGWLAREIIDVENKKLQQNFVEGNDLSEPVQKFRDILCSLIIKKQQQIIEEKDKESILVKIKFDSISKNFSKKIPQLASPPSDFNLNEEIDLFLDQLRFAVNQPNENALGTIIEEELGKEFNKIDKRHVYALFQDKVLGWMKEKQGRFFSYEEGKLFFENIRKDILGTIWFNVKDPVKLFTGRKKELDKLYKSLNRNQDGSSLTVLSQMSTVSGAGGIGKSELARKYAQEYHWYYDNCVWINAETQESIEKSFRNLANDHRLSIPLKDADGKEKSIEAVVKEIYNFFSRGDSKSLFIFDNAEKYKTQATVDSSEDTGIEKFLPPRLTNKGLHILITSRNQNWNEIEVVPLGTFTKLEAAEFIKKALEMEKDSDIANLAEKLQYFPLALQQAASYIKVENIGLQHLGSKFGISDYLLAYEKQTQQLLNYKLPEDSSDLYSKTTFTTWGITMDKIRSNKKYGKEAEKILDIIAYFASSNIPNKIFLKADFINSESQLGNTIELLQQYAMVSEGKEQTSIDVHRLVQAVTKIRLGNQKKEEKILEKSLSLFEKAICSGDCETNYSHIEPVVDHVVSVWSQASKYSSLINKFYSKSVYTFNFEQINNTPLHLLAAVGDVEAIKRIIGVLKQNSKQAILTAVTAQAQHEMTPLDLAAQGGHVPVVTFLLKNQSNINPEGKHSAALQYASQHGHKEVVALLLDKGAKVNAIDVYHSTALHYASQYGHTEVVNYLLEKKADICATDINSFTALHYASQEGHAEVVKSILHKSKELPEIKRLALINQKTDRIHGGQEEDTALNFAAKEGYLSIVEDLMQAGADIYAVNRNEAAALQLASRNGHTEVVKLLLAKIVADKKTDFINQMDKYPSDTEELRGETAIHAAVRAGHTSVVEVLAAAKAKLNVQDKDGNTPLNLAIQFGYEEIIKIILHYSAGINDKDLFERTPLMQAAQIGDIQVVNLLLELGAEVNMQYPGGTTALNLAAEFGHENIIELLLNNGADVEAKNINYGGPLHAAIQYGHISAAEILLNNGADIEAEDGFKRAPLMLAVQLGDIEGVVFLLNKGADANSKNEHDSSVLHEAAKFGGTKIVSALLQHGAIYNARDENNKTPKELTDDPQIRTMLDTIGRAFQLMQSSNSSNEILSFLKSHTYEHLNILVKARNNFNRTLLHVFVAHSPENTSEIIDFLIVNGAEIQSKDFGGHSALQIAIKDESLEKLDALLNHADTITDETMQFAKENAKSGDQRILDKLEQHLLNKYLPGGKVCSVGNARGRRSLPNECISWEDIDEFNVAKKEDRRNPNKLEIASENFLNYLKNSPSYEKRLFLLELANKVKADRVQGRFQSNVNKLLKNRELMSHLRMVNKVSSYIMHARMDINAVTDFLNHDYKGLAINLGFIVWPSVVRASEGLAYKGLHLAADAAYMGGFKAVPILKPLIGRAFSATSSFLVRIPSILTAIDLYHQIKKFQNGTDGSLVYIVADSTILTIDAIEIGIGIAEFFGVLEGVSPITGPIGTVIVVEVYALIDEYTSLKRMQELNDLIHLTAKEEILEGLRVYFHLNHSEYIQELIDEKNINTQLAKNATDYLKQFSYIGKYVFPNGRLVIDSCHTPREVQAVCIGGSGGCGVLPLPDVCTKKIEINSDNTVRLDKEAIVRWDRARPEMDNLFCLPGKMHTEVYNDPRFETSERRAYLCKNAIGVRNLSPTEGNRTLFSLGKGDNDARGFLDSPNIFLIEDGFNRMYGGNKDDDFILRGHVVSGNINGGGGVDTIDLGRFAPTEESVLVDLVSGYVTHPGYKNKSLAISEINVVYSREKAVDTINVGCDTRFVDGKGGRDDSNVDRINIPSDVKCFYNLGLVVRPYTNIFNHAVKGNFTYTMPTADVGNSQITFLPNPSSKHIFYFNYTLYDIENIRVDTDSMRFSFRTNFGDGRDKPAYLTEDKNHPEKSFTTTIKGGHPLCLFSDNMRIEVLKQKLFMTQSTNKTLAEIIKYYPALAMHLKMSIFLDAVASDASVAIGHSDHDVLSNNPKKESHLFGNAGKNVYVMESGHEVLNVSVLPIPDVIIYDLDRENTLDLRKVKQQITRDISEECEAKIIASPEDLVMKLFYKQEFKEIASVTLKKALQNDWYHRLRVMLSNVTMRIEKQVDSNSFILKPLSLTFSKDKEFIVLAPADVENGNEIVILKEIADYSFNRLKNNLIITNTFHRNLTNPEICTILLKDFYTEAKMQTLLFSFNDKKIVIRDEMVRINGAADYEEQSKKYTEDTYAFLGDSDFVLGNTNATLNETASNVIAAHAHHSKHEVSEPSAKTIDQTDAANPSPDNASRFVDWIWEHANIVKASLLGGGLVGVCSFFARSYLTPARYSPLPVSSVKIVTAGTVFLSQGLSTEAAQSFFSDCSQAVRTQFADQVVAKENRFSALTTAPLSATGGQGNTKSTNAIKWPKHLTPASRNENMGATHATQLQDVAYRLDGHRAAVHQLAAQANGNQTKTSSQKSALFFPCAADMNENRVVLKWLLGILGKKSWSNNINKAERMGGEYNTTSDPLKLIQNTLEESIRKYGHPANN